MVMIMMLDIMTVINDDEIDTDYYSNSDYICWYNVGYHCGLFNNYCEVYERTLDEIAFKGYSDGFTDGLSECRSY